MLNNYKCGTVKKVNNCDWKRMMFNGQYLKLIHLLFISIISVESSDQSVPVIKFKPKTAFAFSGEELDSVNAGFKRFSEFTVCFRYMARFGSDFFMIETNQIMMGSNINFGYVILRPWNGSTINDEYRRILPFCKPYVSGHWVSQCLRVKLEGKTQDITFVQDGKECFHHKFLDGDFEEIYLQENLSINDLLR